jgi:hypothetical protein
MTIVARLKRDGRPKMIDNQIKAVNVFDLAGFFLTCQVSGAEYVTVCLPAFFAQTVHRNEQD